MNSLVIDASVAVKWVVEEEGTKEALALRDRALAAPDLLIAECANILWKKVRRNELSEQEAVFAAGLLARADIELMAMRPYLEAAVRIAVALDHPAYDCIYIALAEAEGLRFVTADTSLLRKVGRRAPERYADRVVGLADTATWQE
ncbi:MAG TPA: type II toxin-antitoxin system VapC family toxin [Stellaceae bacterium]|nr:type II toxin-antitoxin system VapC family toxin [Stellaceae bacterium]